MARASPPSSCEPDPEAETLRRAALAAVSEALARLGAGSPSGADVHEARKSLKKARSVLRLSRGAFGEASYRRENAACRAAARALAPARDAAVLAATIERLRGALSRRERRFARGLCERERAREAGLLARRAPSRRAAALLRACRRRLAGAALREDGRRSVEKGLRRAFRRGRRAWRAARRSPSDARFHELRKAAKYLRYQLEHLGPRGSAARRLHRLTDRLGEYHDLSALRRRLRRVSGQEARALRRAASRRQERLLRGLAGLGRRSFGRGAGRNVARV